MKRIVSVELIPEIAEMVVITSGMSLDDYNKWKSEQMKEGSSSAKELKNKIFNIIENYRGAKQHG